VNTKAKVAVFEFTVNDVATISLAQSKTNAVALINAIRAGTPRTHIIVQTISPAIGAAGDAVPLLPQ
jgi:lysophospholipase L1-like esterase